MLLGPDRDRGYIVKAARGRNSTDSRGFPSGWVYFGAVRMWRSALPNDLTRVCVAEENLARLRR